MSLISQIDRKNVISALEYYINNAEEELLDGKQSELYALLNWIKLEYSKNEE